VSSRRSGGGSTTEGGGDHQSNIRGVAALTFDGARPLSTLMSSQSEEDLSGSHGGGGGGGVGGGQVVDPLTSQKRVGYLAELLSYFC